MKLLQKIILAGFNQSSSLPLFSISLRIISDIAKAANAKNK
jgi:hypothetical protein